MSTMFTQQTPQEVRAQFPLTDDLREDLGIALSETCWTTTALRDKLGFRGADIWERLPPRSRAVIHTLGNLCRVLAAHSDELSYYTGNDVERVVDYASVRMPTDPGIPVPPGKSPRTHRFVTVFFGAELELVPEARAAAAAA